MAGVKGLQKSIVDLTGGGTCQACDAEQRCCVCGAEPGEDSPLFYSQTGDHDHLVMVNGMLGREAHGRLMCRKHYLEDAASVGLTPEALGFDAGPDTATHRKKT